MLHANSLQGGGLGERGKVGAGKEAAWRCVVGTCDWVLRDCAGDGGKERPDLTGRHVTRCELNALQGDGWSCGGAHFECKFIIVSAGSNDAQVHSPESNWRRLIHKNDRHVFAPKQL